MPHIQYSIYYGILFTFVPLLPTPLEYGRFISIILLTRLRPHAQQKIEPAQLPDPTRNLIAMLLSLG